ncbi:MAG: prepilin peptidase [Novosphingobium sp.]|nr:prepilin peptidase [Novosphingobium sp.]
MPIIATSLLALCAATGAWLDLASRRLPNWLCLLTAIAGLGASFAMAGAAALWSPAAHGLIALVAGMALFRFGWIGGGDAKFYAACACWFPLGSGLNLLGLVSLAGLAVVLLWFGYRQATGARKREGEGRFGMVPYGVPVAIGAVALKLLQG